MAARKRAIRLNPTQRKLVAIFEDGGCLRMPDDDRLAEGWEAYKKGWEIRFTCRSAREITQLHKLLDKVDFAPGSAFKKGKRWIVPVYGHDPVSEFCEWLDAS